MDPTFYDLLNMAILSTNGVQQRVLHKYREDLLSYQELVKALDFFFMLSFCNI